MAQLRANLNKSLNNLDLLLTSSKSATSTGAHLSASTPKSTTLKKIKIKKKKSNKEDQSPSNSTGNEESVTPLHDKNDLYDMIEKIQGDRLDNQRCEFTQDYSVSLLVLFFFSPAFRVT